MSNKFIGLGVLLLIGCAANSGSIKGEVVVSQNKIEISNVVHSICDIRKNSDFRADRLIRLEARYVSDNFSYSYFSDGQCSLELANRRILDRNRPSVFEFARASVTHCGLTAVVCPVSALVDVEAKITTTDSGGLGIDVLKVNSYKFEDMAKSQ
jgi:hypothetical protein